MNIQRVSFHSVCYTLPIRIHREEKRRYSNVNYQVVKRRGTVDTREGAGEDMDGYRGNGRSMPNL